MSSYNLSSPRVIAVSNGVVFEDANEPAVQVIPKTIESEAMFGGVMKRAILGTSEVPATNEGVE